MRLTSIKITGFKSFADPVIIPASAQLTGIVGPNGCGKSNVVDALRWVMGERSASSLRGEEMKDVIFNGSFNRPSINRVVVELNFNPVVLPEISPWSRFSELNIKRLMYRHKTSDYFINNQKVRRKDISDLFLGTGLAAHSYAIIEQGMVSRIVDSSPKELRIYLEEAAGVSKYKEKRQETENRIKDTKANLLRIEDIKNTISDQVEKLEEQAIKAKAYIEIKNQFEANQRQKAIIELQNLKFQNKELIESLQNEQKKLSDLQTQKTEIEKNIVIKEDSWQMSQNQLEETQSNIAAIQVQIAEIEQNLRLGEQTRQHLIENRNKLNERINISSEQRKSLQEEIKNLTQEYQKIDTLKDQNSSEYQKAHADFLQKESLLAKQNNNFQELIRQESVIAGILGAKAQEKTSIENRLHEYKLDIENLQKELASMPDNQIDQDESNNEFPEQAKLDTLHIENQSLIQKIEKTEKKLSEIISQNQEISEQINISKQKESELNGKIKTLEQQLKNNDNANLESLQTWLKSKQMLISSSLSDVLKPDSTWEHAIYTVLDDWLASVYLTENSINKFINNDIPPDSTLIIDSPSNSQKINSNYKKPGSLSELIEISDPAFSSWIVQKLNHYICCDNWVDAINTRDKLADDEFYISKEGIQIGREHIIFATKGDLRTIYLENLKIYDQACLELQNNSKELQEHFQIEQENQKKLDRIKNEINILNEKNDRQKQDISELESAQTEWQFSLQNKLDQSNWEKSNLETQINSKTNQVNIWQEKLIQIESELKKTNDQIENYQEKISIEKTATQDIDSSLRKVREEKHQIEIKLRGNEQQLQHLNQNLEKINEQQQKLNQIIDENNEQLVNIDSEINQIPDGIELDDQLQNLISERKAIDSQKQKVSQQVHTYGEELKQIRNDLQKCFWQIQMSRDKLEELQLKNQDSEHQAQSHREHYLRFGGNPDQISETIPNQKPDKENLQKLILAIEADEQKMIELEPVNLTSISELASENLKLQNLLKQQTDLAEALTTLGNAIIRIDIETRERLQNIFTKVNQKFSYFFQKIFGGGYAEIILAGDEILDSGVLIKAQPMGKKNSSIHLLSGGEKALTAIALIFSFFSLNPAPFCVLDEIDAPLDDHNTRLFNDLIKDMKEQTQFILITHNRITMESMEILTGITMSEPGVSKMVAVDLLNTYKAA